MNNSKNNSISTWIFVFLSCAFIIAIGYKTKNKSDLVDTNKSIERIDNNLADLTEIIDDEAIPTKNNDEQEYSNEQTNKKGNSNDNTLKEEKKQNIYVNKIIISKNIDNDKNSDTYRNPIDAFKTISTLDESVIKEIDYYPTLFVWSSVNTENVSLINEQDKFDPINLSMTLKCKDKIIDKLEYKITANTPRWREWIEINLENIDEDMLNEFWNVEIVDNNNTVLESRNFKLLDSNTILEQADLDIKTELETDKENPIKRPKEVFGEVEEIDLFHLNNR